MNNHEQELKIIGRIKHHEGGLNEREPAHVGGVSYKGITQQAFDEWGEGDGAGKTKGITSVRDLTQHPDVVDAFYHDYLKYAWHLSECLQYMFCDFYTNGKAHAVKIIQRMVGIDDDGVWGSGTTKAVQAWTTEIEEKLKTDPYLDNELIEQFHEEKLALYESIKDINLQLYQDNIVGWKKRAMRVLAEHSEYFEDDEPVAKAIDPADIAPPPVEYEPAAMPYHSKLVGTDKIEEYLASEVAQGYILSAITTVTEPVLDVTAQDVLVVTEYDPDKAGKLLNT